MKSLFPTCALVLALASAAPLLADELKYKGRTAMEWAERIQSAGADQSQDAAVVLNEMGSSAAPAALFLGSLVRHAEIARAQNARFALTGVGAEGAAAVPDLMAVLDESPGEFVRVLCALESIDAIGPPAKASVPVLVRWLENAARLSHRDDVATALGRIGPASAEAVEGDPRGRTDAHGLPPQGAEPRRGDRGEVTDEPRSSPRAGLWRKRPFPVASTSCLRPRDPSRRAPRGSRSWAPSRRGSSTRSATRSRRSTSRCS